MTDIKDSNSTLDSFDTDTETSHWIGGGKSDASNIVSPEFADITGGSRINDFEIDEFIFALLGKQNKSEVGIDNVDIVSLSTDSITVAINGAGPTTDLITISGDDYLAALAAADNGIVDLKDGKAQFAIFDTDATNKIFIGGGKSNAVSQVGQEFADITGGTNINVDEVGDLLAGLVTGKGWKASKHGMEGVELVSLTTDEFAIKFAGDIVLFTGAAAKAAIDDVSGSHIDIKNNKSQVAQFDTDTMKSMWIGGGKSDAVQRLGQEFADITGGSRIHLDEIDDLFSALVTDKGWGAAHDGLGPDVELVGLTEDSFTIALHTNSYITDTITFAGEKVGEMIDEVEASGGNGVTDFDWTLIA